MNRLIKITQFHKALADYSPSHTAMEAIDGLRLVLLNAPTGGGRNTIINELLITGEYHFIISDTTRAQRINNGILEQNGREYWFRSEDDVLEDIKKGEFLEAEVIHNQQVSGISIRELLKAKATNKIAIDEVEFKGIANVVKVKPDTVAIVVLPPNFDTWMERIRIRGEMSLAEQKNRFETAIQIYKRARTGMYDVIVNDDLQKAVELVNKLAHDKAPDLQQQLKARELADELYWRTVHYMKAHFHTGDNS